MRLPMSEPFPDHEHQHEPEAEGAPAEQSAPLPAPPEDPVEGEIVLAEVRPLPARPAVRPAVQTAAVAVGGFVAGAATFALVRRGAQRRPAARSVRSRGSGGGLPPIVATRRYLVDVHLLGRE
jgi:hypothetical protein